MGFLEHSHNNYFPIYFLYLGIPHPPTHRLTLEEVFDSKGEPRIKELRQHFILEGRVTEQVALRIIRSGAALLRDENTVLDIDAPVTGKSTFASNLLTDIYFYSPVYVRFF